MNVEKFLETEEEISRGIGRHREMRMTIAGLAKKNKVEEAERLLIDEYAPELLATILAVIQGSPVAIAPANLAVLETAADLIRSGMPDDRCLSIAADDIKSHLLLHGVLMSFLTDKNGKPVFCHGTEESDD